MNVVMIIPTGIGCEIGGHAGDATPSAKLLGSVCDKLILHPNVVNASDINEMPSNSLYVEGSMLDRFLEGDIELKEVRSNRILITVNKPLLPETINAISAARATMGIDIEICALNEPLVMDGYYKNGIATGDVSGYQELLKQVWKHDFDALAIASPITVDKAEAEKYLKDGGINPWGGVEAKASRLIASELNMPVAHAPVESAIVDESAWKRICDPRMAAEFVSMCYVACILKGLHKAPRIGKGLSVEDIDVMVSPSGCWGRPHYACVEAGIPIIIVKENSCVLDIEPTGDVIYVENYIECAGYISAMTAGISPSSVRRPLMKTKIIGV